jgi:chloride channel 7
MTLTWSAEVHDNYGDTQDFTTLALFLFWSTYMMLACWTYGLSVPSGLFVPSLLAGAAMGSLFYQVFLFMELPVIQAVHPGLFVLVGSASGLGGMARMTISLTVILIELTGVVNWAMPIMVALIVARWTGNYFNEGLYDIHVHLKNMPFLEPKPEKHAHTVSCLLCWC